MSRLRTALFVALVLALAPATVGAQSSPWGRVSFYATGSSTTEPGGTSRSFSEVIGSFPFMSPAHNDGGLEYGVDLRSSGYPTADERRSRVSIYDGFVGWRTLGGRLAVRGGQIWLNDLGGLGSGGLTYFFANARVTIARPVEIQGTYHRGRSIDTRTITIDQLQGRPVSAQSLQGLLFESAGGRVWVTPFIGLRLFAGFSRDRNNRDDVASTRTSFGAYLTNLLKTGLDLSVSDYRTGRNGSNDYDSWSVSVGRSLGPRVYLSGDYSTSLAVLRLFGGGDVQVENRPRTHRYQSSAIVHLTRATSLLVIGEYLRDNGANEARVMSGVNYRLK